MNPIRTPILCAPLLLAAAASAQEARTLTLDTTAAGTAFSLDGGPAFHVTANPVQNARLVDLDGSPRFVVTWDEQINERQLEAWYGISLDGVSLAAAKATSYDVLMRRQRFDPANGGPDFSQSKFPASSDVYIVQFITQPIEEYLSGVGDAGASVYGFVSNHSYLMRMSPSTRDAVQALPYVRWVGPYHTEYRVEPYILAGVDTGTLEPRARYNIQLFEKGLHQKQLVKSVIEDMGGAVDPIFADELCMVASMTPEILLYVTSMDEVVFVDRWSAPETDLNVVRNFSGANYLETTAGFTGNGVRGEVQDSGLFTNHVDFQHNGGPLVRANGFSTSHGTQCTGVVFGDGTGNSTWRGILPDGKIVFRTYNGISNANRKNQTAPLVNPGQPYQCVFQTNSWGSSQVTIYNNSSTTMDDVIFDLDLLILNSQSNTGSTFSRPEAWAKNVLSVGGINHNNTATRADDFWGGASHGPAEDGRIKPDLAHFYDSVTTPAAGGGYSSFGGTSLATAITAGYGGLFYEMWHNDVFNNAPTGAEVFASRPHFSTAKAALIATATQWNFNGTGANLTRLKQGFGAADLQKMYDLRDKTIFVDQSEVIDNLETISFQMTVAPGEPQLKCTLTWPDPPGTTSSSQHRFNNLDLRVTEPDGTTLYWGNRGLKANMWNNSAGNPKSEDTVECVFLDSPTPGVYTVEVIASEIVTDIVSTEPGLNAVYSLWIIGATLGASGPTNYCTAGTSASGCQALISGTGTPSASATSGFTLDANGVEGDKDGLFFFGTNGRQANPWGSGTSYQCVVPPVIRAGLLNGVGTPGACDGTFSQDMNALWCATCPKPTKNPGAGATVQAQLWYRDPMNTSNQTTSLSDAYEFAVAP